MSGRDRVWQDFGGPVHRHLSWVPLCSHKRYIDFHFEIMLCSFCKASGISSFCLNNNLGRFKHIRSRTVVKSCSSVEVHRILGVSYRLHLQGLRQERNQLFVNGSSCYLFITVFLLESLTHHEDGDGKLLRNVGGLYSTIQLYNPPDCTL